MVDDDDIAPYEEAPLDSATGRSIACINLLAALPRPKAASFMRHGGMPQNSVFGLRLIYTPTPCDAIP